MADNVILLPLATAEVRACSECGAPSARLTFQHEHFPYGVGEDQVELVARVPVWRCEACGFEYTDEDAEDIRHATICRHLGRLTPAEVKRIRAKYGMSQQEWAERTGLGIASVKRWETGNLIQNAAYDRFVRLLDDPAIFARVASMADTNTPARSFKFQTELPETALQYAAVFLLRKSYTSE